MAATGTLGARWHRAKRNEEEAMDDREGAENGLFECDFDLGDELVGGELEGVEGGFEVADE